MGPLVDRQLGGITQVGFAGDQAEGVVGMGVEQVAGSGADRRFVDEPHRGGGDGRPDPHGQGQPLAAVEHGLVRNLNMAFAIETEAVLGQRIAHRRRLDCSDGLGFQFGVGLVDDAFVGQRQGNQGTRSLGPVGVGGVGKLGDLVGAQHPVGDQGTAHFTLETAAAIAVGTKAQRQLGWLDVAGAGGGHRLGEIVRGGRDLGGFGQFGLDGLAFLQRDLVVAADLFHSLAVPLGLAAAEIVADADDAILAGGDLEPGGGIVLALGGDLVPALGAEIGEGGLMPAPGRRWKDPDDAGIALAGRRAPALQQHLLDCLRRQEIAFERERPVGEAGKTAAGLVAIGMKPVAEDECLAEDVEMAERRFRIADPGPQAAHPGEAVAAPAPGAELVPLRQRGLDPPGVGLAAIAGDQVERIEPDDVREMAVGIGEGILGIDQQHPGCIGVEIAERGCRLLPLLRLIGLAAGIRHLLQREEEHLQAHQVVVGIGLEPGAAAVVEDFGRRG